MNTKELEEVTKKIIRSVVLFQQSAERGSLNGAKQFINDFPSLLKRFRGFYDMADISDKTRFTPFMNEVCNLFEYLFADSKIFQVGGSLLDAPELMAKVIAIKHNGNPLPYSLKKPQHDLYTDFVKKYNLSQQDNNTAIWAFVHFCKYRGGSSDNLYKGSGKIRDKCIKLGKEKGFSGESFYHQLTNLKKISNGGLKNIATPQREDTITAAITFLQDDLVALAIAQDCLEIINRNK
jgi:hypothetical protein